MSAKHFLALPPLLVLLAFLSPAVMADVDLTAPIASSRIEDSTSLGTVFVEGSGEVSLSATRSGNRLVVHAHDAERKVIGRAESVVGLSQTPIYVLSADGLKKITIFWNEN